ncbi:MAG: molybdopterin cofactor-binding domain-containing protein [Steroidobacterales bacterium]
MNTPPAGLNRRDFLASAAAGGAGLVIALSLPAFGGSGPKRSAARSQLNAWLQIGADNSVTVLVDRSEMGQGVYTALPMLLAEELGVDMTAIRIVAAPVGDAYVNQGNGGQITGTSNSISDAWVKLRTAGAQARTMLISAAAQAWVVSPADCRAEHGSVVGAHGQSLSFGQLAAAAGKLPVPKDVKLKEAADFKLIGSNAPRLDTPGKVDGSAEFGIDVRLPGMLYAAFAQSPVLGGKLRSVDADTAGKMPGVRHIMQNARGVIVVADHFWQALKARDALKIAWDAGSNASLGNAAIASLLRDKALAPAQLTARTDGDPVLAMKGARKTLTAIYELPLLAHAPMEPMNCTADVHAGGCDLYVGTQVQQLAQSAAAAAAGVPPANVRVFTTLLGGAFGRRLETDFIPAAVEASKAVGRPVKLIWTREDDLANDYFRPPAAIRLGGALDSSGKLTAWDFHSASPSITARFDPTSKDPFDSVLEAAANYFYEVPNVAVRYTRQEVGVDVGYLRSVSHAINCFAIESFMDELAAAAGVNGYEFRHSLLANKPRHRRVLEEAARLAAWGKSPQAHFQGIALMEGYTTVLAQVAEISIGAGELKVRRITCVVDCGQQVNPRIIESQVEGGIVFGLSAALWGNITIAAGRVQQTNFHSYRVLRSHEMPQIDVHLLHSDEPPGGIGEPAVALVAPAVCNAIYAATATRLRALPIGAQRLGQA